jgi:hypothetical protein
MRYPLSHWITGDLVTLQWDTHHHYRNKLCIYIKPYSLENDVAYLYCINDGTFACIHASYIREPKKNNET